MLDVVEDEQELAVPQRHEQPVGKRLVALLPDADGLGDGGNDEVRIAHRGQIDEADAVGELRDQVRRDLQREPGLAYPTRTGQRQQRHVLAQEQLSDRGDLPLPANQRGAWQRKRRRTVRQRQGHSHSDPVMCARRMIASLRCPLPRSLRSGGSKAPEADQGAGEVQLSLMEVRAPPVAPHI